MGVILGAKLGNYGDGHAGFGSRCECTAIVAASLLTILQFHFSALNTVRGMAEASLWLQFTMNLQEQAVIHLLF
jgi:hypothetical protein